MALILQKLTLTLALACVFIASTPSFAAPSWCGYVLGSQPSRRDLEALSDYSATTGSTRYFFRAGELLGSCKDGKCLLFNEEKNEIIVNFASHAEILKRQNPNRDLVTTPEEMKQVSVQNLQETVGIPEVNAVIDNSSSIESVVALANKNAALLGDPLEIMQFHHKFIITSGPVLLQVFKALKQSSYRYIWITNSQGKNLGLYLASRRSNVTHHQLVVLLFGRELAEDKDFVRKFIRGGHVSIDCHRTPNQSSFHIDCNEAFVNAGENGGLDYVSTSEEEDELLFSELEKFIKTVP